LWKWDPQKLPVCAVDTHNVHQSVGVDTHHGKLLLNTLVVQHECKRLSLLGTISPQSLTSSLHRRAFLAAKLSVSTATSTSAVNQDTALGHLNHYVGGLQDSYANTGLQYWAQNHNSMARYKVALIMKSIVGLTLMS